MREKPAFPRLVEPKLVQLEVLALLVILMQHLDHLSLFIGYKSCLENHQKN